MDLALCFPFRWILDIKQAAMLTRQVLSHLASTSTKLFIHDFFLSGSKVFLIKTPQTSEFTLNLRSLANCKDSIRPYLRLGYIRFGGDTMFTTDPSPNLKEKCNSIVTFTFIKGHGPPQSLASISHQTLQLSIALTNVAQAGTGVLPVVRCHLNVFSKHSDLISITFSG